MSLSPAVLDAMLAAGCTAEQIVAAVKADQLEAESRKASKREGTARRTREYRARKRGDVTHSDACDASHNVTPLDKEIPPKPPKEINPPISPVISNEMTPPPSDLVTVEEVVDGWNTLAAKHGLAQIVKLSDQRRRKAKAQAKRFLINDWVNVFAKISQSPFLRGENDRGWRCDFDFILSEQNFIKILEGKYDPQPIDCRR